MTQLSLFTSTGEDLTTGGKQPGGVHLPPRPATEAEVVAWLKRRGYRVTRGATTRAPDPEDRDRLSAQCRAILAKLQEAGPYGVWNADLARIALKYTGRISELRGAGYQVEIAERRGALRRYVLVSPRT